jgi:hypothetical protein
MAMKIYDEINKHPSQGERLKFGATVLGGLLILGLLQWFVLHRHATARGMWMAGVAVFVLALVPPIGRVLYILWMGLGITLGLVTSPIVLVVIFLVVITPVGLVFRLIRRDAMRRKLDKPAQTYWEEYPETEDPATYVKQF